VIPLQAGAPAGILDLNASFWIELVAFLLMLGLLARYAYPRIISAAEGRQRQIAAQLEAAEAARREAEEKLAEAEARLQDARNQAQEVISAAARSADQIREQAVAEGMKTLSDDGILKVLEGVTTIDELLRVVFVEQ